MSSDGAFCSRHLGSASVASYGTEQVASIGHIAIGLAAGRLATRPNALAQDRVGAMLAFTALSMLPDADVVMWSFGIDDSQPLGHRGASHSIAFAIFIAAAATALWCRKPVRRPFALRLFGIAAVTVFSHGAFDALTNGGAGVSFFWPLSEARSFAPWRPIPVSPIGIHFFTRAGLRIALFELVFFGPFWLYAVWPGRFSRSRG